MNTDNIEKIFGKTIIPFEAHPEKHEIEIAKILNKYGKSVEFLIPLDIKNTRELRHKNGWFVLGNKIS